MAEIEHDIDELEERIRTAIQEVNNLEPGGLTDAIIDHLVLARKLLGVLLAGGRRVETP